MTHEDKTARYEELCVKVHGGFPPDTDDMPSLEDLEAAERILINVSQGRHEEVQRRALEEISKMNKRNESGTFLKAGPWYLDSSR